MAATRVWIRNPDTASDEVYVLGTVVDDENGELTVKLDNKKQHAVHMSDAFTANPEGFICPDNTMLIHLSEATLLANLRTRYQSRDIYTLTGSILLVRAPRAAKHHSHARERANGQSHARMRRH